MSPVSNELRNAILATNFFLSLCMVLISIQALIVIWRMWENREIVCIELWILSILWLAMAVYQLLFPQGTMMPGLSYIMVVIFTVTFLLFLIPSLLLERDFRTYAKTPLPQYSQKRGEENSARR